MGNGGQEDAVGKVGKEGVGAMPTGYEHCEYDALRLCYEVNANPHSLVSLRFIASFVVFQQPSPPVFASSPGIAAVGAWKHGRRSWIRISIVEADVCG